MKNFRFFIWLISLVYLPALYANSCSDFLAFEDAEQHEQQYQEARENFIRFMAPGHPERQGKLFTLIYDYDRREKLNLPLEKLTDELYEHYEDTPEKRRALIDLKVEELEHIADCHDFGERSSNKIMHFVFQESRYLPEWASRQIDTRSKNYLIGFLRPKEQQETERMVRVTNAATCTLSDCQFEDRSISSIKDDLILLTHSGTQKITHTDFSEDEDQLADPAEDSTSDAPKRVLLQSVDLKEHTELFGITKPDLVLNVAYFRGESTRPSRVETTPIPWVTATGHNNSPDKAELIFWNRADRAVITLIEKNWNIPSYVLSFIFKELFSAGKIITGYQKNSVALVTQGLLEMFTGGNAPKSTEKISGAIARFSSDQVVATAEITRFGTNNTPGEYFIPERLFLTTDDNLVKATLHLVHRYEDTTPPQPSSEPSMSEKDPKTEL